MFSSGLEVATGWDADLPEEGKKVMTNKAGCQLPVSTWQEMVHHSVNPPSLPLEHPALLLSFVLVLQAAAAAASLQAEGAKLTVP